MPPTHFSLQSSVYLLPTVIMEAIFYILLYYKHKKSSSKGKAVSVNLLKINCKREMSFPSRNITRCLFDQVFLTYFFFLLSFLSFSLHQNACASMVNSGKALGSPSFPVPRFFYVECGEGEKQIVVVCVLQCGDSISLII